MKTKKKITSRALAVLLAFVMSVSLVTPALADETEADDTDVVTEVAVEEETAETEPAEPTDTIDIDDEEGSGIAADIVIENDIREDAESEYIESVEGVEVVNYIRVMNTLFNGEFMEKNDTISSIMAEMKNGEASGYNKFLSSTTTVVAVYDVNEESDYFVAKVNTMMNTANVTVFDWTFAKNDDSGTVIEGCYFDPSTGLAYIPKELYFVDGTYTLGGIQVQLGQRINGSFEDIQESTTSSVLDEGRATVYTTLNELYAPETEVSVEAGLNENEITVLVNGMAVNDDLYEYDSESGILTLDMMSPNVGTVSVVTDEEQEDYGIQTLSSDLWYDEWNDRYYYIYPDNWNDVVAVNQGNPIDLPGWVTVGTALVSENLNMTHRTAEDITGHEYEWYSNASRGYQFAESIYNIDKSEGWLYDWVVNWEAGRSLAVDWSKINLQKYNEYFKFKMSNSSNSPMVYTNTFNGGWIYNVYSGSSDPAGQTISGLSTLGDLLAQCTHVDANAGGQTTSYEMNYYGPALFRVVYKDTDSSGQDFIIAGIVSTPDAETSQTAFGFYRIDVGTPTGTAQLQKVSGDTNITSNNSCYSLAGAEYCISKGKYTDSNGEEQLDSSKWAQDANGNYTTFKTDANGWSNVIEYEPGTYYVKECTASPGYELDKTVYTVVVSSGETTTFKSTEQPIADPVYLTIDKIGDPGVDGIPSLEGAQFTIKFYGGEYTQAEINSGKPSNDGVAQKTWVIQTLYDSSDGEYETALDTNHKISGDDYYKTSSGNAVLPLGTITVQETKAPDNYKLTGSFICDYNGNTIASDGGTAVLLVKNISGTATLSTGNEYTKTNTVDVWGGIKIPKIDRVRDSNVPEGDATLAGAEFTIYSNNDYTVTINGTNYKKGDAVLTITTGEDGVAVSSNSVLYFGDYYAKETKAPTGYLLNEDFRYDFSIRENGVIVNDDGSTKAKDTPITGNPTPIKLDFERDESIPQGDATLEGAEFTIYNQSINSVIVNGVTYEPGDAVMTVVTDENGYAATNDHILPYGTYSIKETKAPVGYLLNEDYCEKFEIRTDGQTVVTETSDKVQRGGLGIYKYDEETYTMMDGPQGDGELVHAGFTITNKSENAVYIENGIDGTRLYEPDEDILFIETSEIEEDGHTYYYAETAKDALPYGTYLVTETQAPTGYLIGENHTYTVEIRSEGQFTVIDGGQYDPVIRGGVEIVKRDLETGEPIAQGSATLANAELTIYNESLHPVLVNDKLVWPEGQVNDKGEISDGVVAVLYTDEYGYAATDDDALPYGSYKVVETQAPDGYLPRDQHKTSNKDDGEDTGVLVREFTIREQGEMFDLTDNDYEYDTDNPDESAQSGSAIYNQVIRGDFAIRKITDSQKTMPNVMFQITSKTTGETHYFKTDENGGFSSASEYALHSYKTDIYDDEEMWNEVECTDHTGLWFCGYGDDVDSDGAPVRNDLGALPYDTYVITEIRTDANTGYTLWSDEFTVGPNSNNVIIDLNNIEDKYKDIDTYATFDDSSKYGPVSDFTIISDDVDYQNFDIGQEYSLVAKLYNITDECFVKNENGDDLVSVTVFTPRLAYGTARSEIIFDSTGLEGCDVVVYEYVYEGTDIENATEWYACETDPTQANQIIHFPGLATEAVDSETGTNVSYANDHITIIDTVEYSNLKIGRTYTVKGTLMDKETGEPLLDDEGNQITAETSFMAKEESGTVDVEFTFSEVNMEGVTTVVFEDLYYNNTLYASHADIEDEGQTVYIPKIHTNAWSSETEDQVSHADGTITLYDTIHYKALEPGIEYTVYGVLLDAETREPETDADGNAIDAYFTFTPTEPEGETLVTFTFDASNLEARRTVFYEVLYMHDGEGNTHLVAVEDVADAAAETIYFPEILTTAIADDTGIGVTEARDEVTITDIVAYDHLMPGYEYTVIGILMDRETGNALTDADGAMITSEATFIAESDEGTVEVEFTFDASLLEGTVTVVYEELFHNDVSVASHADIEDEGQSVYIPDIGTEALDSETGDHIANADSEITLVDNVAYHDLKPGVTYTVTGTLMDKDTEEPVLDDEGNEITAEAEFTPEEPDGVVEVEFTFSGVSVAGRTTVAFETVEYEGTEVAVHADIEDDDQSVKFPAIHTTALDSDTETHMAKSGENMIIVDTVEYENLIPGLTYTMTGILTDKNTSEALTTENGDTIASELEFTPEEESGTVEVMFIFDGSRFAGTTVVVFEGLFLDGETVATHTDLADEDQTVYIPDIGTTALDSDTEEHFSMADEEITIIDTVEYTGLKVGEEYTVIGVLMDQATGESLLDDDNHMITAETVFTPEEPDGTVEVVFTFPGATLAGTVSVVYEELFYDDLAVAIHADLTDEGQTVYIPEVHTTAADSETEDHISLADDEITIIDTVEYSGLKVGEVYTVTGTLMDKETGEPVKDDGGNEITAEAEFFAERADGTVDVTFTFSGVSLAGKSVVAFEDLWYEDTSIAVHADIEDEDQTVCIPDIHTTAVNKATGEHEADADGTLTIVDTVEYENLIPGVEYTMRGELMDASDGSEIGVTSEIEFTPEEPDGSVEVEFETDATVLGDVVVVVFEYCDLNKNTVAQHTDLEDTDQQVTVGNPPASSTTTTGEVKTGDIILYTAIAVIAAAAAAAGVTVVVRRRRGTTDR